MNSVKWPCSPWVLVAQWIEHSPSVREVMGSSPVGDSDFSLFHVCVMSWAHHKEPATTSYSWHGVFTDRSIFISNIFRIQIPTGTSVTNCNHKHGLLLPFRHDVDMFTWTRIVLSSSKTGKISKISKFSAPTIAFLAFWLAKKLRLWANSRSFTSYGK